LGSFAQLTFDFDAAAMIFDDALTHEKSQTQASALFAVKKGQKSWASHSDRYRSPIFDFYDACWWAVNGRIDFSVDPTVCRRAA
jgi:hypothetical protein